MKNLSGLQFRYTNIPEEDSKPEEHGISAYTPEGKEIGMLGWKGPEGEIDTLGVHKDYRRQGVATAMWHEANRVSNERGIPSPSHSPYRTDEGNAWAKSFNTKLPRRKKADPNQAYVPE